jgi:hypothetical protein
MLNTIVDNIETHTNEQNVALCWRDQMYVMFDDGLDYDEFIALNKLTMIWLAFLRTQKLVNK